MKWKPIYTRRLLVWGAWGVVLVVGLSILGSLHAEHSYQDAIRAFEQSVGSADHRDYLAQPVPDRENIASAFVSAVATMAHGQPPPRILEPAAWSGEMESDARAYLNVHRPELERLREVTGRAACSWPDDLEDIEGVADASWKARDLLRVSGLVAIADRDEERFESSFRALATVVSCLYRQPHFLGSLVAVEVERSLLELARAVIASPRSTSRLLDATALEIRKSAAADRVKWAVAAEGAFALLELDVGEPVTLRDRLRLRPSIPKRVATALASRWIEFERWSRQPLDVLVGEESLGSDGSPGPRMPGAVAQMTIRNLRPGVSKLRANRELLALALVAIEARQEGAVTGSYAGLFPDRDGLSVLTEADGSTVLIDTRLERLLRGSAGPKDPGLPLELTVWRLPPPRRPG